MNLNNQIKKAKHIMNYSTLKVFDNVYDFTTENMAYYLNNFDLENKNLFTVGSSGDQVLNAIVKGCLDITLADINPFSYHYLNLKRSSIIALCKEEFEAYLISGRDDSAKYFFSKEIYNKVKEKLKVINEDSLYFWNYLYNNFDDYLIGYILFQSYDSYNEIKEFNLYLNNNDLYNLLQDRIKYAKINFINKNIYRIKEYEIEKEYDNIILSNIYDYNNKLYKFIKFKKCLNKYINLLSDNGTMLVTYLHDISKKDKLEKFKKKGIVEDYDIKKIVNENGRVDSAIIYQKKKN